MHIVHKRKENVVKIVNQDDNNTKSYQLFANQLVKKIH